jgi:hypothetical protein
MRHGPLPARSGIALPAHPPHTVKHRQPSAAVNRPLTSVLVSSGASARGESRFPEPDVCSQSTAVMRRPARMEIADGGIRVPSTRKKPLPIIGSTPAQHLHRPSGLARVPPIAANRDGAVPGHGKAQCLKDDGPRRDERVALRVIDFLGTVLCSTTAGMNKDAASASDPWKRFQADLACARSQCEGRPPTAVHVAISKRQKATFADQSRGGPTAAPPPPARPVVAPAGGWSQFTMGASKTGLFGIMDGLGPEGLSRANCSGDRRRVCCFNGRSEAPLWERGGRAEATTAAPPRPPEERRFVWSAGAPKARDAVIPMPPHAIHVLLINPSSMPGGRALFLEWSSETWSPVPASARRWVSPRQLWEGRPLGQEGSLGNAQPVVSVGF